MNQAIHYEDVISDRDFLSLWLYANVLTYPTVKLNGDFRSIRPEAGMCFLGLCTHVWLRNSSSLISSGWEMEVTSGFLRHLLRGVDYKALRSVKTVSGERSALLHFERTFQWICLVTLGPVKPPDHPELDMNTSPLRPLLRCESGPLICALRGPVLSFVACSSLCNVETEAWGGAGLSLLRFLGVAGARPVPGTLWLLSTYLDACECYSKHMIFMWFNGPYSKDKGRPNFKKSIDWTYKELCAFTSRISYQDQNDSHACLFQFSWWMEYQVSSLIVLTSTKLIIYLWPKNARCPLKCFFPSPLATQ